MTRLRDTQPCPTCKGKGVLKGASLCQACLGTGSDVLQRAISRRTQAREEPEQA